jgi:hypothetical protein
MIDVAYLRIYRPAEEVRLPVAVGPGDVPRLGEAVLTTESQRADAWEVEWQGLRWRCPRTPRRRMLESLVAHQQATERFGWGMIDRAVAEAARRELSRLRTGAPGPSPVMTSAWHPPLRWFLMFSPDNTAEPMILRARVADAVQRLELAVAAMERAGLPPLWVDEQRALVDWLGAADGEGMVELDYRQVAERLDPVDRVLDDTVSEVARSLEALGQGDLEEATRRYTNALARWADAQAVAFSS